jgi:hypothetical protein
MQKVIIPITAIVMNKKKHFTLEAMESWLYQDSKQVTQFSTRLLGNVSPNFTSMDFSSK